MEEFKHYTVMKNEAVDALECKNGKIYVDCTLGGGGHSGLILSRIQPDGHLIAFDVDDDAIKAASERLKDYKNITSPLPKGLRCNNRSLNKRKWPSPGNLPPSVSFLFWRGTHANS